MRTTVELSDRTYTRLRARDAERGMRGFSAIVEERSSASSRPALATRWSPRWSRPRAHGARPTSRSGAWRERKRGRLGRPTGPRLRHPDRLPALAHPAELLWI